MAYTFNPLGFVLEVAFLVLQAFIVVFLLFHDWVPLGRWNNGAAKQSQDTRLSLMFTTLMAALPSGIGLLYSALYFGRSYPHWLEMLLWITYGLLFLGLLRAWWIPYLILPDEKRAARYQTIFADSYAFLPRRNGIVPDALHCVFHLAVVSTLLGLFLRNRLMG